MIGKVDETTKVFGIGLSKTGTSSLTEALNNLGVKSIHYPHDDQTYNDLRDGNYALTITQDYQGVVDIPVAPFYAQLDGTFPGSKFVLTVREKGAWLRSTEVHWRLMMNWWHQYPQFKKVHEFVSACVYGTIRFNADRFSYVYDTHVRNVQDYFRNRPESLLVMDICGGEGWEKLCPFLGLSTPDAPFPRANEWMHLLLQAAEDISSLIPPGETFILVDEQGLGPEVAQGRRSVPFLERDGEYWGPPADDETAIRELERLRREGANFAVFAWPAFWWLDHYAGFHSHLRVEFRCLMENKSLVLFDLRD